MNKRNQLTSMKVSIDFKNTFKQMATREGTTIIKYSKYVADKLRMRKDQNEGFNWDFKL
jgi:hypothetical protein